MKFKVKFKRFVIFSLCVSALLVYGCHGARLDRVSPADLLEQRVSGFLKARQSNDKETAYGYYSPDYRKKVSLAEHINNQKAVYFDSTVESIEYVQGAKTGRVFLRESFDFIGHRVDNMVIPHNWVLVDGVWYIDGRLVSFKDIFTSTPK
ncbi:putative penicillin-binding protein PBP [Desulforapulum autotrophicum HRM2]|uniref:Penicillin-binding protein PBP n=1 Tax=Desulforapulum autotrophicum (strain ATCC 43914 / DSM 3382 / VKM B-1955 / HRM2) TaxID=177437 RepID=C0QK61_DESAH|nr:hypothetical protein [Desulforapulum autotrophicum]ACN16087.1 putative penicillin-binding protein PBP [Desulforapulum autotrophicum HRM2]